MRIAGLEVAQAEIKIARRDINNLRYADDTTLMAESEEELKSLFTLCHKGGVICISEVVDMSLAILIPACASSSPVFLMMYSAYKLNKQSDNIQP